MGGTDQRKSSHRDSPPDHWPAEELTLDDPPVRGIRSRWMIEPAPSGWGDSIALGEWELVCAGWEDVHPNEEINIVLEGELHVESGGATVVVQPGGTVRVRTGCVARYWAPRYAKMIVIQGPNPSGRGSQINRYWEVGGGGLEATHHGAV